jgi:hypothetical protein
VFADARERKLAERPAALPRGRVEYSVTSMRHVVKVLNGAGEVVDAHEGLNVTNPPLKLRGRHSMTSIAKERAERMAAWYQIPTIKKVKA